MYPNEEPVAIEVKMLERKKIKLLSELERLEHVKVDKFKDVTVLQNQAGLLDRQLLLKKKELYILLDKIDKSKQYLTNT